MVNNWVHVRVLNSTESNVMDMEGKEMEDCDGNQAQSLCCKTLEGADEDDSVAHISHNDACGTPINRKMKGKKKNTQIDKVFDFLVRKHLLDATEHIFLGCAKIRKTFSPERQGVVKN